MTTHLPDSPKYTLRDKRGNIETVPYLPRQGEIEGAHSRVQNPVACRLTTLLENVDGRIGIHIYHLEIIHFRDPLQEDTQEIEKRDHMSPLYQEREGGRSRALHPIPAVARLHSPDPELCINHCHRRVIMKEEEADGCGLFHLPDIRQTSDGQHRGLILGQSRRREAILDQYRALESQYPGKEISTKPVLLFSP